MCWGMGAATAPARSISASAAGAWPFQSASRSALTSSFVRPVLTLCGWSSASQPSCEASSRLWMSSHCSPWSSSKAVLGALPGSTAGPDDREPAFELLAVEDELELAVGDGGRRIAGGCFRLPGPPVPDDDVAGAVLLGGDHAFEVEVLDGVVLDVDGHAPDLRIERRALGHGPANEHAGDLEAEVVVQASRAMSLDDEPAAAAAGLRVRGARRRLRGLREVALATVFLEGHQAVSVPDARDAVRWLCAHAPRYILGAAISPSFLALSRSVWGGVSGGISSMGTPLRVPTAIITTSSPLRMYNFAAR